MCLWGWYQSDMLSSCTNGIGPLVYTTFYAVVVNSKRHHFNWSTLALTMITSQLLFLYNFPLIYLRRWSYTSTKQRNLVPNSILDHDQEIWGLYFSNPAIFPTQVSKFTSCGQSVELQLLRAGITILNHSSKSRRNQGCQITRINKRDSLFSFIFSTSRD